MAAISFYSRSRLPDLPNLVDVALLVFSKLSLVARGCANFSRGRRWVRAGGSTEAVVPLEAAATDLTAAGMSTVSPTTDRLQCGGSGHCSDCAARPNGRDLHPWNPITKIKPRPAPPDPGLRESLRFKTRRDEIYA